MKLVRTLRRLPVPLATALLASCLWMVVPTRAAEGAVSAMSGSPAARSSITINRPAGTAVGHVMVALVAVSDETVAVTAPDGWSLVADDAVPGAIRAGVYLKRAGPAEDVRYTWSLSEPRRVAGGITAYENVAAEAVDAHAVALQPEAATALVAPPLTTSAAGARLVVLTAAASDGNLVPGTGLAKRWQIASRDAATSRDVVASIADAVQVDPGPAPELVTTAARPGPAVSVLLALRPAGPPGPADTDPPITRIESGPPETVTSTTATFVFSADEPASFTCALDGAAPVTCSSPITYSGLIPGAHYLTVVATDLAGNTDPALPTWWWTVEAAPSRAPVLVGAGDIADCRSKGDEATAALVEKIPGTVFTLGDNAYVNGLAKEFKNCYEPTWGRFKHRTMPAVGNHEYQQDGKAEGYYDYFGTAAGDPAKGYYDYTLGSWHVIVLNSECRRVGGCGPGSPQERWLRQVLAASKARCTAAITHHARFSSAKAHGSSENLQPLWQALYDYGAEIVLSGHDHTYERFGPQRPGGGADAVFGIRQFVVGTGGRDHRSFGTPVANSEVRNGNTYGVLKLTLHPDSYDWEFVPEAGKSFTDSGTTACHDAPGPVTLPPLPVQPGPITPGGEVPPTTPTSPPTTTRPTS